MRRLRRGRSIWLARPQSSHAPRFPPCRGRHTVDVAIIGGGITGAVAAYLFADAGLTVALVEAARVGRGSTVASTALLMQEPDEDFRDHARRYGAAASRRIWEAIGRANTELASLIGRLGISCEFRASDSIYFTMDAGRVHELREEFDARRRAGLPVRWLSARALARRTGIHGAGAILTSGNGQLNPYDACLGFLHHAVARGARVFEYSRASRVTAGPDDVRVTTAAGQIRANAAVIATGYATREFKPLAGRFRMMQTYVIGTYPAVGRMASARLTRGNTMLWDTNRPYHYLRWTQDGCLLFGGADRSYAAVRSPGDGLGDGAARLQRSLERIYPALSGCEATFRWTGVFAQTPDGLPYIGRHRRYPRHLFALGYGGNGMSVAYLAAVMLLRQYLGERSADEELFAFGRARRLARSR